MPTREQLQANINAMEKQGASPAEIQGYLNSLKGKAPAKPAVVEAPDPNAGKSAVADAGIKSEPSTEPVGHIFGEAEKTDSMVPWLAKKTYNAVQDFGIGIGQQIGKAGTGLGGYAAEVAGWGLDKLGFKDAAKTARDVGATTRDLGEKVYGDPFKANEGIPNSAGKLVSEGAMLASGGVTKAVTGAQNALKTGAGAIGGILPETLKNIPYLSKAVGYTADLAAHVAPEAAVGYNYGRIMGETPDEAKTTALLFGGTSGAFKALGDGVKALRGTVAENVVTGLGMPSKMSLKETKEAVPKSFDAIKTVYESSKAKQIMVEDADGVLKAFDPKTTTYGEFAQAFHATKDDVYNAYTSAAQAAGGKGATFGASDFDEVISALRAMEKDTTEAHLSKITSTIKDLERNFGIKITDTGVQMTKPVDLIRMQNYVQKLSKSVKPQSDSAAAEVAWQTTSAIRKMLDDKILNASGQEYQAFRTKYSNMLAVEKQVIAQFKRSLKGGGSGISDALERYGTIEAVSGLLTGGQSMVYKGLGLAAWGITQDFARSPIKNLRRVFDAIEKSNAPAQSGISERLFGRAVRGQLPKTAVPEARAVQEPMLALPEKASATRFENPTINLPREAQSTIENRGNAVAQQGMIRSNVQKGIEKAKSGQALLPSKASPSSAPMSDSMVVLPKGMKNKMDYVGKGTAITPAGFALGGLDVPETDNQVSMQGIKDGVDDGSLDTSSKIDTGAYTIKRIKSSVSKDELDLLGKAMYSELANVSTYDDARRVANVAINRMKLARGNNMPGKRTLADVLSEPRQFQGVVGDGRVGTTASKALAEYGTEKASKARTQIIEQVLNEIKEGKLVDNTGGKIFFTINPKTGRVVLAKDYAENRRNAQK
jgi:hypothetical protein